VKIKRKKENRDEENAKEEGEVCESHISKRNR
jgi:hypothetical protein